MKIAGIIAEFNPFHNGHKYLIDKTKELTGADIVICIMSGNFTQAGNIAIINKFKRAKIAIENGVDVVIELPTIYATASSQYFAYGAINLLNSLNCVDYLCFGSETADITTLQNISKKILENKDFLWLQTTKELKNGISFAKARENALNNILTKEELATSSTSNNILAIEYIKSLIMLKSSIIPIAIKREENNNITSATNIRNMICEKESAEVINNFLPSSDIVLSNPILNDSFYEIIKYNIVYNGKNHIKNINEVTEGLENKIIDEINNSNNYYEFIQNIKSKRYQLSKIRRILLNILLNISKEDFANLNINENLYAHILAISPSKKNTILSMLNKISYCNILTSINDNVIDNLKYTPQNSLKLDIKASNIYSIIANEKINLDYNNKI